MTTRRAAVCLALLPLVVPAGAAPAWAATDCLADAVAAFDGGYVPQQSGQRVSELPGIVLGPPGDSFPVTGSVSTVSLGRGGSIVLAFTDNVIVDGPGADFIVFENAFFKSFVPADANQPYSVFVEPGAVAASEDGVTFVEFPYEAYALSLVGSDGTPSSALPALRGLAGITPDFTGNWTIADDPDAWDPAGSGGVSGAGGDAFDLADVGLSSARFIRIVDLDLGTGFAGPAEGFDLGSIVALNSLPVTAGVDTDGDGLSDGDEIFLHGSDPADPDSDDDGASDGAEAARCRSPLSASVAPVLPAEPNLWIVHDDANGGTHVRLGFISSAARYDVVRGWLPSAAAAPVEPVLCVENDSFNLTTADHADGDVPSPGTLFYYLARVNGQPHYGLGSDGAPRQFLLGDCP
jgi:hypothetical protein